MMTRGESVPACSLPLSAGGLFVRSEQKGKWLMVYFYLHDDTHGCTQEACDFRDRYSTVSIDHCVVVGISRECAASHHKFRQEFSLQVGVLVDEGGRVCTLFDGVQNKNMDEKQVRGIQRGTFLIDPDGGVVCAMVWRGSGWACFGCFAHVETALCSIDKK